MFKRAPKPWGVKNLNLPFQKGGYTPLGQDPLDWKNPKKFKNGFLCLSGTF